MTNNALSRPSVGYELFRVVGEDDEFELVPEDT